MIPAMSEGVHEGGGEPIRLVCFDLGGVVVRICRSWEEGCAAAGVTVPRSRRLDPTDYQLWHALTMLHQAGRMRLSHYAERVSRLFDGEISPDEVAAIHHAWMFEEYDGIGAVIDAVHASGRKTAALSNTTDEHWVRLEAFPTISRLHWRLASHQLGLCKPDPAIYRAAERRVGCRGGAILFFDDLEENVLAARAAGWQAECIDPLAPTAPQILDVLDRYGVAAR